MELSIPIALEIFSKRKDNNAPKISHLKNIAKMALYLNPERKEKIIYFVKEK